MRDWVDRLERSPLAEVEAIAWGRGDEHGERVRQLAILRAASLRWPEDAVLRGAWVVEAVAAARGLR